MGRPSVKTQRREQILDAYEACVAQYGVEGASLEKVAETAGLARPLIRHNVGNREELLEALVERFLSRSNSAIQNVIATLPPENSVHALIDSLFDQQRVDTQVVLVAEALIAAGQFDRSLAKKMRAWTRDFISNIKSGLENTHPHANADDLEAIAAGITGIYFNADSLAPLGRVDDIRKASKRAATLLVTTLEDKS